jgi:DnaJ homolog subfamily C member 1
LSYLKIVGIYDVLKDEQKRKRYNEILEFGLPDWKDPVFYYRRVRKLNFIEVLGAMAIIIVIGHYFVLWAQYFEQKLCLVCYF